MRETPCSGLQRLEHSWHSARALFPTLANNILCTEGETERMALEMGAPANLTTGHPPLTRVRNDEPTNLLYHLHPGTISGRHY